MRQYTTRIVTWVLLVHCGAASVGCATISPPHEKSLERVVASTPVVQARRPLLLYVKDGPRWVSSEELTATVYQQVACEDGYRETVATERVVSRDSKNVGPEAVLGGVIALTGAVLLLSSPTFDDTKEPGTDSATPRERAQVWGAIGALGGLALLGHAGFVGIKAGSEVTNRAVTSRFRASGRPARACGSDVAGPGVVLAMVANRTVPLARPSSGLNLSVQPRAAASELCSNAADEESVARLVYISRGQVHLRAELGRYALKDCVLATVADQKLAAADSVLSRSADIATTVAALKSLESVEQSMQRLSPGDPTRRTLITRILSTKEKGKARARELRDQASRAARDAIHANLQEAVAPTAQAMDLARLAQGDGPTWVELYEAFAKEASRTGLAGYALLAQLVAQDAATAACYARGLSCPEGISQKQAQAVLAPAALAATKPLQEENSKLREALTAFRARVDTKNVLRADAALQHAAALKQRCSEKDPLGAIDDSCSALVQTNNELLSALSGDARVEKIRRDNQEAEEKKRLSRVVGVWRKHFADCRRLAAAVAQLQSLGSCDAGCQIALERMRAEEQRQQSFRADEPINDVTVERTLREECGASHCDVCP